MECSCTAGCDYEDDRCTGYNEKTLRAAKIHKCCECGTDIAKGEDFVFCSIMMIGDISNYKMCMDCHDITNKFFSDGFIFTQVLDDLEMYFDGSWLEDLPSNCISKLRPKARNMVCDMLQHYQTGECAEVTA